jgi:hypothetical protein
VEDRDPIKQLQHLLDDPGGVLEKISRIQSALGSIPTARPESDPAAPPADIPKSDEPDYSALLQTIRDMQTRIEQQLRPLAVEAVQAETHRLAEWMQYQRQALDECLARIDDNLLTCVERIHESQARYMDLAALKKRLEELGAPSPFLPEFSPSQDPIEIITARLETLHRDGKI